MRLALLDTKIWNLAVPIGLLSACGPTIPLDATGDGTDTDGTTSDTSPTTDPTNPTNPTDPTDPTDTGPECNDNSDCPTYYVCLDGVCEYEYYCSIQPLGDGYYTRCSPPYYYECYDHDECGPGEVCDNIDYYYSECQTADQVPPCPFPPELTQSIPLPNGTNEAALALTFVDANGDNDADLVLATNGGAQVVEGPVVSALPVPATLSPGDVAVGDVDRDGNSDIVFSDLTDSGSIEVALGDGAGGFSAGLGYAPGQFVRIATGDFDGDGNDDVVGASSMALSLLASTGAGGFASLSDLVLGGTPIGLATARINADPLSDVAFHQGGSAIGYLEAGELAVSGLEEYASTPVRDIAVGDFNADGNVDVAGASDVSGTTLVVVWEGYPGGGFETPRFWSVSVPAGPIAVGDVDGDGGDDLVLGGAAGIGLLLGSPGGENLFGCSAIYGDVHPATAIAVGDMDGDGRGDIAFSDGSQTSVLSE